MEDTNFSSNQLSNFVSDEIFKHIRIISMAHFKGFAIRDNGKWFNHGENLQHLDLENCITLDDNILKGILRRCSSLSFLNIKGCKLLSDVEFNERTS